jgi:hypothetical protein
MNTLQINKKLAGRCKSFLGTFPANHIPTDKRRGFFVLNLDDCEKPGSHWVVLGECEFFDSYGIQPLSFHIFNYLRKNCNTGWWNNDVQLQGNDSTVCAHYCIYYILMRCKGLSPDNIVNVLRSKKNPDRFVYEFVRELK